jgi:soluble lytic murein transglycosylase
VAPQVSSATARISRRAARTRVRRRRFVAVAVAAVLGGVVAAAVGGLGSLDDAVREITLPLKHDDIIRQQAGDKDLDAALIAAVIYEESRFRDQTSPAGARGLMQITPETADFIARRSGGNRFVQEDLATPQINIAYGSFYLRYLIDRYDGSETLAIAAYNAGQTNVDRWVAEAGGPDAFDSARHIPFPETRAYVENVSRTRESYREHYADDLGL